MPNSCHISLDYASKEIAIKIVDDSTGQTLASASTININLNDLSPDGIARQAQFRWFYFKDSGNGCAPLKMMILCTPPETDSNDKVTGLIDGNGAGSVLDGGPA